MERGTTAASINTVGGDLQMMKHSSLGWFTLGICAVLASGCAVDDAATSETLGEEGAEDSLRAIAAGESTMSFSSGGSFTVAAFKLRPSDKLSRAWTMRLRAKTGPEFLLDKCRMQVSVSSLQGEEALARANGRSGDGVVLRCEGDKGALVATLRASGAKRTLTLSYAGRMSSRDDTSMGAGDALPPRLNQYKTLGAALAGGSGWVTSQAPIWTTSEFPVPATTGANDPLSQALSFAAGLRPLLGRSATMKFSDVARSSFYSSTGALTGMDIDFSVDRDNNDYAWIRYYRDDADGTRIAASDMVKLATRKNGNQLSVTQQVQEVERTAKQLIKLR